MLTIWQRNPDSAPKKKQSAYYSGKKKRHTLKSQIVVDKNSRKIICTHFGKGKRHDFHLFKESKVSFLGEIKILADSGYQGLQKIHSNSIIPNKKSKGKPLSKEDKKANRELSKARIINENVIAVLKRFKVIAEKYRNRHNRFGLRFNLIAGIYNYELDS